MLQPKSFSEFDRFSPVSAGERTRLTINRLAIASLDENPKPVSLRDEIRGIHLLTASGYDPSEFLVVLNPAGSLITKSWPIENYIAFARLWKETANREVKFLVLGTETILAKARALKSGIGDGVIDLAGKTTPGEAFNIIRRANLVLSEDSGLMHMAWVAGAPTVALFGSSKSSWSRPLGTRSVCLDSSDLECGECLQPACRYGDVRCLTRYTPEFVAETARKLLTQQTTLQH